MNELSKKLINVLKEHLNGPEQIDLEKIAAFIQFIFSWNYLIHSPVTYISIPRFRAYRERIQRKVKRDFPDKKERKRHWKELLQSWSQQQNMPYRKSPLSLTPLPSNPANRPRMEELWWTVYDLKNYFVHLTRRAHWGLVAAIVNQILGRKKFSNKTINSEFSKRRRWFSGVDGQERIKIALGFYQRWGDKIDKAVATGIPVYETLTWSQTETDESPKLQPPKTETIQTGIDDDHWFNVMAKKNLTIGRNRYKKGQQFVVLPKIFDEKTMLKIGTLPRCEPFTKFVDE